MDEDRIQALTPAEKAVLRLLSLYGRPGAIAAAEGGSVNTINNHLKSARAKLGVTDSLSAARILAGHEGRSQSVASHALVMGSPAMFRDEAATAASERQEEQVVREERTTFTPEPSTWSPTVDPAGARHHDLSLTVRVAVTIGACVLLALFLLAVHPLAEGFAWFASLIRPTHPQH